MRYERNPTQMIGGLEIPGLNVLIPEAPEEAALTRFERSLAEKLLAGDEPGFFIARHRISAASVLRREFSGVGCFISLEVPDEVAAVPPR